MRFIIPSILIAISLSVFFMFANPIRGEISELSAKAASYNEALGNSKTLENERDKLTAKYNSIDPENLKKLEKFLPQNVDNIRLILEIEQIAAPYGMVLSDVKYNTAEKETEETSRNSGIKVGIGGKPVSKDYGVFDLEFSTSGKYSDFINFTRDLENNLRIVDISSIEFSSASLPQSPGKAITSPDTYKYDFIIKTYWLKD